MCNVCVMLLLLVVSASGVEGSSSGGCVGGELVWTFNQIQQTIIDAPGQNTVVIAVDADHDGHVEDATGAPVVEWAAEITINANVAICGVSEVGRRVVFDAKKQTRHFSIIAGMLTLQNLNLVGGHAATNVHGGAVYVSANAVFVAIGCEFRENHSGNSGGSVYLGRTNSEFYATRCDFIDNYAQYGGAVGVGGPMTFVGNNAVFEARHCTFRNSARIDAPIMGGAIYLYTDGKANCTNCTFIGNTAAAYGGAVYLSENSYLNAFSSKFSGNHMARVGGAIYSKGIRVTLRECVFRNNDAGLEADEIFHTGTTSIDLIDCDFGAAFGNSAVIGQVSSCSSSKLGTSLCPGPLNSACVDSPQIQRGVQCGYGCPLGTCNDAMCCWAALA